MSDKVAKQTDSVLVGPNPENLRFHLIRAATGSFFLKLSFTFLSFVTNALLARMLGTSGYGIYAFCLSISEMLTIPSMMGSPGHMVREISIYRLKQQWGLIKGLIWRVQQGILLFTIVVVFFTVLGLLVSDYITSIDPLTFCLAMGLVPLSAAVRSMAGVLRGMDRILLSQLAPFLYRNSIYLLLIAGWALLDIKQFEPFDAMILQIVSVGLCLVILYKQINRFLPPEVKKAEARFETALWFQKAWPMALAVAVQVFGRQVSTIILGVMQDPETVGIYRVAQRGADLVIYWQIGIQIAMGPTISKLYAQGELVRLQKIITKSVLGLTLFSFPVALGLILEGEFIVSLLFGPSFHMAAGPLALLCGGQVLNITFGATVVLVLMMTGYEKISAAGLLISVLICVPLCFLMIPFYGATGAALATAVSQVLSTIYLSIKLYQKTRLISSPLCVFFSSLKEETNTTEETVG